MVTDTSTGQEKELGAKADPARELAADISNSYGGITDEAVDTFVVMASADAATMLAVIGDQEWRKVASAYYRRTVASPHGAGLRKARAPDTDDEKSEAKRTTKALLNSVLNTLMIAGKPLAACSRREVESEARRTARLSGFYTELAARLPDPAALVGAYITPAEADKIWRAGA